MPTLHSFWRIPQSDIVGRDPPCPNCPPNTTGCVIAWISQVNDGAIPENFVSVPDCDCLFKAPLVFLSPIPDRTPRNALRVQARPVRRLLLPPPGWLALPLLRSTAQTRGAVHCSRRWCGRQLSVWRVGRGRSSPASHPMSRHAVGSAPSQCGAFSWNNATAVSSSRGELDGAQFGKDAAWEYRRDLGGKSATHDDNFDKVLQS
jgi:hypothetical protein